MSAPVIEARGLGKRYRVGATGSRYQSLRETLSGLFTRDKTTPFWALEDCSFDVEAGDIVGIIGPNGAGKSTLLKILSRITTPTTGEARLRGRVASLLEVGTGFHPELTGRENIHLNGAVMGMSRADVAARFDEIVAFAEVERFLETPVKHYSSGMRVRLAFAVAAHLEPDILVIDEVLAVGDAAFQKKSLGKMAGVATSGRAVLFVSHNMAAVTRLCRRAMLLRRGRIVADGPVAQTVGTYLGGDADPSGASAAAEGKDARLHAARLIGEGQGSGETDIRKPLAIEIDWESSKPGASLCPNITLYNQDNQIVFWSLGEGRAPGKYRSRVVVPGDFLAEGMFSVDVAVTTLDPPEVHVQTRGALTFHVTDPAEGDSVRRSFAGEYPGVVRPKLAWTTEAL